MKRKELINLLLRVGLAGVFLYAAVSATLTPNNWIGFLPQFIKNLIPGKTLLEMFNIYEVILSIWLLSGWKTFYSASLCALTIFGILITGLGYLDITFRDFGLLLAAAALALNSKR